MSGRDLTAICKLVIPQLTARTDALLEAGHGRAQCLVRQSRLISQIVRDGYAHAGPTLIDRGRTLVLVVTRNSADKADGSNPEEYLEFYETETGRLLREQRTAQAYAGAGRGAGWIDAGRGPRQLGSGLRRGHEHTFIHAPRIAVRINVPGVFTRREAVAALDRATTVPFMYGVWPTANVGTSCQPGNRARIAPDGKTIVTCGTDGTALVWDLPGGNTSEPAASALTDREIEALGALARPSTEPGDQKDTLQSTRWLRAAITLSSY